MKKFDLIKGITFFLTIFTKMFIIGTIMFIIDTLLFIVDTYCLLQVQ